VIGKGCLCPDYANREGKMEGRRSMIERKWAEPRSRIPVQPDKSVIYGAGAGEHAIDTAKNFMAGLR